MAAIDKNPITNPQATAARIVESRRRPDPYKPQEACCSEKTLANIILIVSVCVFAIGAIFLACHLNPNVGELNPLFSRIHGGLKILSEYLQSDPLTISFYTISMGGAALLCSIIWRALLLCSEPSETTRVNAKNVRPEIRARVQRSKNRRALNQLTMPATRAEETKAKQSVESAPPLSGASSDATQAEETYPPDFDDDPSTEKAQGSASATQSASEKVLEGLPVPPRQDGSISLEEIPEGGDDSSAQQSGMRPSVMSIDLSSSRGASTSAVQVTAPNINDPD